MEGIILKEPQIRRKENRKPADLFPPGSRLISGKVPLVFGGLLFLPNTEKLMLALKRPEL